PRSAARHEELFWLARSRLLDPARDGGSRERAGGPQAVGEREPIGAGDEAREIAGAELLASRALRRRALEEGLGKEVAEQFLRNAPRPRERSSGVVPRSRGSKRAHDAVEEHVARTAVEGERLIERRSRAKSREIRDAAEIHEHPVPRFRRELVVIEERHERRSLTAREKVGHSEVRDDRHAERRREHGRLPDLDGHALSRALSVRIVEDGLPVVADDLGGRSGRRRSERVACRARGDLGHLDVHAEELAQRERPLLCAENAMAEHIAIRPRREREELGAPARASALDLDDGRVRAVRGRPAHDADGARAPDEIGPAHRLLPFKMPSTIWRWKNANATTTGSVARVEPARSAPQSTAYSDCANSASPTGSVRMDSDVVKTSGWRNAFH